jgi:hypothetical protein
MSRKRPSKKDREKLKREGTVTLRTGEAKIRVDEEGTIMSTSAGWGSEGIAQAETNAIAGLREVETQMLKEKTADQARARGEAKRGKIPAKVRFLMEWIDEQFDDFPQWWEDKKDRGDSWRRDQILAELAKSPNPTRGDAEIVNGVVMIKGKRLTAGQIRAPVNHLVVKPS